MNSAPANGKMEMPTAVITDIIERRAFSTSAHSAAGKFLMRLRRQTQEVALQILLLHRQSGRRRAGLGQDLRHLVRRLHRTGFFKDEGVVGSAHHLARGSSALLAASRSRARTSSRRRRNASSFCASSSSIRRPLWMIPRRVASRSTSVRMWLDMKTVTPSRAPESAAVHAPPRRPPDPARWRAHPESAVQARGAAREPGRGAADCRKRAGRPFCRQTAQARASR